MNYGQELILVSCMIINPYKEILLLHRKDHDHYETPGGKIEEADLDPESTLITHGVLKRAALREMREEIGEHVRIGKLELFVSHRFQIPDGRKAVVYKLVAPYKFGLPEIKEPDKFDGFNWFPMDKLERFNVSPDLKELAPEIKARLL